MLFHTVFCACFLAVSAPKTENRDKPNSDAEKSEAIFADVIKNISRVNNVLQELINNYEQLQKIYKSQENFDAPEYSSEAEVDHFFKNNKKANRDKERSFFHYTPSGKASSEHITQMILSEAEKSHEETEKPKIEKDNKLKGPKLEKTMDRKPTGQKSTTDKNNDEFYPGETSSEEETTKTPKTKSSTATAITTSTTTEKSQVEPEIVFVDTHKKMLEKMDKRKPRIMPEIIALEKPKKLKTRYSVKDMPGSKDESYGTVKSKVSRDNRTISQSTSKRFLQVGFDNKEDSTSDEVTLIPELLVVTDNDIKPTSKPQVKSRSATSNKTAKIFVANDVRKGEESKSSSEMTDDDEALTKDLFKTSVLRQAYGDACLKLVVKKCYKACVSVLKSSCRVHKCRSELKSYFKEKSEKRCGHVFDGTPDSDPTTNPAFRRLFDPNTGHVDLTRAGYLSVVCQPRAEQGMPIMLKNEPSEPTSNQNVDKELNVLRDRYEKACAKISQDKCKAACDYAQNATCAKFECAKGLKKKFRKNCSVFCKRAYSAGKSGKDSDDSGSGSDSRSGSDSGSDSS